MDIKELATIKWGLSGRTVLPKKWMSNRYMWVVWFYVYGDNCIAAMVKINVLASLNEIMVGVNRNIKVDIK